MIDKNDSKTVDAFPFKKRGRPSTGNALTPADRKRLQRERDRAVLNNLELSSDLRLVTVTGLVENILAAVNEGDPDLVRSIANELSRRARFNRKALR